MGPTAAICTCTRQDYEQILEDLQEFWDGRDTRALHHPMLVNEFGNSAFVARAGPCRALCRICTPTWLPARQSDYNPLELELDRFSQEYRNEAFGRAEC
jgi:hypothetical protein